jgi:hypothetical protein
MGDSFALREWRDELALDHVRDAFVQPPPLDRFRYL